MVAECSSYSKHTIDSLIEDGSTSLIESERDDRMTAGAARGRQLNFIGKGEGDHQVTKSK